MTKGKLVLVTAHMESGSYEGKDGQPVYTYEPHVDQVTFLGKANNNGNAEGDGGLKSAPRSAGSQRQAESFDDTVTDDDVPF